MSDTRFVRLKPYNKKVGHVVKRYHVAGQIFIGQDQSGNPRWYKVDTEVASLLATKRQNPGDPNSIKLFDVHTEDEYRAISLRERDLRLVEMGLASASAVASGPSHQAEAKLVDRSLGRAGAVPGGDIPSAAKPPADPIKVEEVGPSSGEPVMAPVTEPAGERETVEGRTTANETVVTPEPAASEPAVTATSDAVGEGDAMEVGADAPSTDSEESSTTSRRRRPSGD